MNRLSISLVAALFLLPTAAGAEQAVEPASEPAIEAPQFFVERISVEGLRRASPGIVLSESLLQEGESYSEEEISQGARRILKLPFVLDLDVSLRRGSERGRYELVLAVLETKRFFFGTELVGIRFGSPLRFEDSINEDGTVQAKTTIGIRQFLGSYGLAFAAVGGGQGLQVGFTHYRLFGRPIFATLAFSETSCCTDAVFPLGLDPAFDNWSASDSQSASLTVGVPIRHDRSLRLSTTFTRADSGDRAGVFDTSFLRDFFRHEDLRESRLEATWIQDSTDDPLFPTQGELLTAGLDYRYVEAGQTLVRVVFEPSLGFEQVPLPQYRAELLRAIVTGARHFTPWRRQTFSLTARAALGHSRLENLAIDEEVFPNLEQTVVEASVGLRHSLDLRGPRKNRRAGELRWENTLDYGFEATSLDQAGIEKALGQLRLGSSITYRNAWGVFRFGLVYLDVQRM